MAAVWQSAGRQIWRDRNAPHEELWGQGGEKTQKGMRKGRQTAVSPVLEGRKTPVNPDGLGVQREAGSSRQLGCVYNCFPLIRRSRRLLVMTFPAAGKFSPSQPHAPTAWLPTPQNRLSETDFTKVFQRLRYPTEALPWQSNLIWKPRILLPTTSETFQLSPAAIHISGPPNHEPMPGSLFCLMGTSVLLLLPVVVVVRCTQFSTKEYAENNLEGRPRAENQREALGQTLRFSPLESSHPGHSMVCGWPGWREPGGRETPGASIWSHLVPPCNSARSETK